MSFKTQTYLFAQFILAKDSLVLSSPAAIHFKTIYQFTQSSDFNTDNIKQVAWKVFESEILEFIVELLIICKQNQFRNMVLNTTNIE